MNQNERASQWLSLIPRISWILHDTTLYAIAASDDACHHLIVTKKAWDWAVWKQGEPPETVRYGTASSACDAMTEAQLCALSDRAFTDGGVAAGNLQGGGARAGRFFGPVWKRQGA
jgi:hypothetical protein